MTISLFLWTNLHAGPVGPPPSPQDRLGGGLTASRGGFGAEPNGNSIGPPARPLGPLVGGPCGWPQWRGPDGLGVSSERNLPEVWSSSSENIRWKIRIPGQANSSPVVSNGRAILTTAYESPKAANWQIFIAIVSSALTLVFLVIAVAGFLRDRRGKAPNKTAPGHGVLRPAERRLMERFNTFFRWFTSLCFVCFALLVTVGRGYSELVLGKVGFVFWKLGLGDMEHLWSMAVGVRAGVWLTSGGIALLGLAAAAGWPRAHSIWRLIGVAAVMLGAIPLAKLTPLDQWKEKIALWEKLVFGFPALAVAFWHLLNYFEIGYRQASQSPQEGPARRGGPAAPIQVAEGSSDRPARTLDSLNRMEIRWRYKNLWHFGNTRSVLFAGLLVIFSLLVFVPPNFFEAQLGMQRVVLCVDMKSGSLLWEQPVFIAPAERKHADGTYATPTPATDGHYIVANFGVGVACLDFEGRILWQKWDQDYVRNTRYGAASSPLLTDDLAVVVQECEQFSKRPTWIAAFDKRTGLTRWRIEPENVRECFTTPLLYRDDGSAQLIVASWGNVASYDIESGKFLWMERIPTQQLVASMARSGELLCVGGGTWGPNVTIMMRLSNSNGPMDANTLWQSDKDTPWDCSPVIYDGKLFTISDTGKITCYDALTGEVFWNERLKGSRYLSSLVAGDGKVYACNTTGLTTVIAADAEFKIIAENDLKGRCYASPAIADGCILLRIADYLYCIEKKNR